MARKTILKMVFAVLLVVLVVVERVNGDSIRPSHPDIVSSLQDPKYKIDFHPLESPVLPTLDQETMLLTDRDGKRFRCNLPVSQSTTNLNKGEGQQNGSSINLAADDRSMRKTPEDLLDALKDKCFRRFHRIIYTHWQQRMKSAEDDGILSLLCMMKYEGWWIYELCYKGQLRQFHLHDKKAPISTYGPDIQHGSVVYFFTLVKQPSRIPYDKNTRNQRKLVPISAYLMLNFPSSYVISRNSGNRSPPRMELIIHYFLFIVQEFVLGTFDAEATAALHQNSPNVSLQKDPRSQSAAQSMFVPFLRDNQHQTLLFAASYHAHVYTNGTVCDLTDQRRETEVRFVCSETGRALINSIKEAPTCKYTVVFHAPMLCKHPAFQEERQPWVVINCNTISEDEDHGLATAVPTTDDAAHMVETEDAPLYLLPSEDTLAESVTISEITEEEEEPVSETSSSKIDHVEEPVSPSENTEVEELSRTSTREPKQVEQLPLKQTERVEQPLGPSDGGEHKEQPPGEEIKVEEPSDHTEEVDVE